MLARITAPGWPALRRRRSDCGHYESGGTAMAKKSAKKRAAGKKRKIADLPARSLKSGQASSVKGGVLSRGIQKDL
jgi:hypothetical protein